MSISYTVLKSNFSSREVYYPKLVQKQHMSQETLLKLMRKNTALESGDLRLALSRFRGSSAGGFGDGLQRGHPPGQLFFKPQGPTGS
jgi:hypothetical protein